MSCTTGAKGWRRSRGLAAIERNTGPHQIVEIGRAEQDAGGVGETRRRFRQLRAKAVEQLSLRSFLG